MDNAAPATLAERLTQLDTHGTGKEPSGDDLFDLFLGWTIDLGIELYPAQEEAVLEILTDNHVLLNTPTGSGKSLVAVAMHLRSLARGRRSFYTSPIKALVSEKFFALCETFGAERVGMMTGDSSINRDADIICCTAEILANIALREGAQAEADDIVMDEFHYYSDAERGWAWQVPLISLPYATFLLMSATLGDTRLIRERLAKDTGKSVAVVSSDTRPVPLTYRYSETHVHEQIYDLVGANRAPIYLVHFTQRDAAEQAQNLMSSDYASKDEKKQIAQHMKGFKFDTPYGKDISKYLRHGVGLHHGGLLPKYRLLVERLSRTGLLKVICGTDTLGVGVNVPIRTVLFTKLCKYDGNKVGILGVRDFKQIAGRAGRKGFDDEGFVVVQAPEHVIENARQDAKVTPGKKKKKVVRKQPPKRGYVPWNEDTYEQLIARPPEPLVSSFNVTHSMMMSMLQREDNAHVKGGGYRRLVQLIAASHERDGRKSRLRRKARGLFKSLLSSGLVVLEPSAFGTGRDVLINEDLQFDFTLMHSLSLFLVEALETLSPDSDTYALDVLALVEAILEHPRVLLMRQVDKLKTDLINRLKSEGVEYDERMAALDEVEHPKPNADQIYALFNLFSAAHPWVGADNIRPKGIMRDMVERYLSFNDYVKELGLEKVEGVLLRYLSQGFKTLVQTVPSSYKNDALVDLIAFFRTTLARVDSSLIQEWERMMYGEALTETETETELDISRDKRVFFARIRAELHALVKALAHGDYEEAEALIRQDPAEPWDAARLEAAMAPYVEEFGAPVFDHRARFGDKTRITPDGLHRWSVAQVLVDTEEQNLWAIHGVVDLRDDKAPEGPMVQLIRIEE